MTMNDKRFHDLLTRLDVPAMPAGLNARLNQITQKPQARGFAGFLTRLMPLEDLSFGLRHDLRYQAAAACLVLTLSLGAWQGVQLHQQNSFNSRFSDEAAVFIATDPVLAGAL